MEQQNRGSKKPMKTVYIVVIVIVIIIIIGWLVRRPSYYMAPAGVDVSRNTNGSVTYTNDQGTATVGSNVLPANWPSDAPKYPNAKIQYSGSSNPQTGEQGSAIMFMTSDSAQKVADFYKTQLASNGWTVDQTAMAGPSTVISAKKDTRTFGVYITDSGNGQVSVSVGIGMPK